LNIAWPVLAHEWRRREAKTKRKQSTRFESKAYARTRFRQINVHRPITLLFVWVQGGRRTTMEDVLIGIVALGLGAAVCFLGLRLWFIMLPFWGFFAGFFVGAAAITGIFGDGFLSTVTGWVVGFIVGLVFAVLSYLIWYVGVIIGAGSVGALLGSGLMGAFNVDSDWVVFIVSAIGAVLLVILAFILALPIYFVVVETAILGATAAVAGVMLIFDQIDHDELEWGSAWAMIQESWFWVLVWIVVAAAGLIYQLRLTESVTLPEEKWTKSPYGLSGAA
jgi:hypothetical protein